MRCLRHVFNRWIFCQFEGERELELNLKHVQYNKSTSLMHIFNVVPLIPKKYNRKSKSSY